MKLKIAFLILGLITVVFMSAVVFVLLAFPKLEISFLVYDALDILVIGSSVYFGIVALKQKVYIQAYTHFLLAIVFVLALVPLPIDLELKKVILYFFDIAVLIYYPYFLTANRKYFFTHHT